MRWLTTFVTCSRGKKKESSNLLFLARNCPFSLTDVGFGLTARLERKPVHFTDKAKNVKPACGMRRKKPARKNPTEMLPIYFHQHLGKYNVMGIFKDL